MPWPWACATARRPAWTRWHRCSPIRRWPAYGYLSAARADFLRQLHEWTQAAEAYEEALMLTDNDVERAFLTERLGEVRSHLRR